MNKNRRTHKKPLLTETLSTGVTEELKQRIEDVAERNGRHVAQEVRIAIERHVAAEEARANA